MEKDYLIKQCNQDFEKYALNILFLFQHKARKLWGSSNTEQVRNLLIPKE